MAERTINILIFGVIGALVLYAWLAGETFLITLATRATVFAVAAVGLNLALGYGGLVSFGHAAFFGLGGYVTGILASHALNYQPILEDPLIEGTTQLLTIWPLAVGVSVAAALLIGLLSLRTSGVYFIMITLAFAQMIYYFAISWPAYGGEDGLAIYVRNEMPGFDTSDPLGFFALAFIVLGAALLASWRITRSRFGLALTAARENPGRVSAVGIRPFGVQLTAFAISAGITALAGALYADLNRFVSPVMFSWETSGEIIVIVILGGVGRLMGPVAGAFLFIFLEHWLGGVFEFWKIFLGLILLGIVLYARGGLIGILTGGGRA